MTPHLMTPHLMTPHLMTPQQEGKNFELYIYNILQQSNYALYTEQDIRKKYKHITAIDHILECNNTILCFQDKWTSSTISNEKVNHFISAILQLEVELRNNNNNNYKFIGIYLSKNPFSKPAQIIANKFPYELKSIYCNDFNTIKNELIHYLYSKNIYLYDHDNDIIMNI